MVSVARRRRRLVWVEDRPHQVQRTVKAFRGRGDELKVLTPDRLSSITDTDALDRVDAVLLDLRMPEFEEDGRSLARSIIAKDPNKPLLFVSSFFHDGYEDVEHDVAPYARTQRFDKNNVVDYAIAMDNRIAEAEVVDKIAGTIEELIATEQPRADFVLPEEIPDAFATDPAEYFQLGFGEKARLVRTVRRNVQPMLDFVFGGTAADWIVVGGPERSILRWGIAGREPNEDEVRELASEAACVPFVICRPTRVDAVQSAREVPGYPWLKCRGALDYPAINIELLAASGESIGEIRFDTGSDHSYLDLDVALNSGLVETTASVRTVPRDIGVPVNDLPKEARDRLEDALEINFVDLPLQVVLGDGSASVSGEVRFRAVHGWSNSTLGSKCAYGECDSSVAIGTAYTCDARRGLLGPRGLSEVKARVIVDGVHRVVRLAV